MPKAFLFLILLLPLSCFAQSAQPVINSGAAVGPLTTNDSVLRKTISSLAAYTTARPTEKVYLQLDKPHYDIGDTIWFKAYTVIGEHHQLSALSGVLYVELINGKDSVAQRLNVRLVAGTGRGNINLPMAYKPGEYHIRAYTQWMRNEDAGYFYNRSVQIGGMPPSQPPAKQVMPPNPDVQFFPEGGQLVNGVRSRVAVKSVASTGLGEDINGTIEDNEGNSVADFSTQHLGMGVFAFTPQSGKLYKAKIATGGETSFTVDLPKAMDAGLTLAVNNNQPDTIFVKVAANQQEINDKKGAEFYITAQSAGKIYYTSQGIVSAPVDIAKVEKSRFPSGIVQFTLFDQNGMPLAERIVYMQNPDTLKLNMASGVSDYTVRQPVKINVDVKDADGKPAPGSFSVAVINESRVGVTEADESTILNNLLLTSDLKGYVEQPNYYFTNVNDTTRGNLDALMLTQGYRRFEWKRVLAGPPLPPTYEAQKTLAISGMLKTNKGQPAPGGKITLMATKQNLLIDTVADQNGYFSFPDLHLPDTTTVVLRARQASNSSKIEIYVQQPAYPSANAAHKNTALAGLTPEAVAALQKDYEDYQQQTKSDSLKKAIRLKEVTIQGKKPPKPDVYNNYGSVYEYDLDMSRLAGQYFILNALPQLIPGVELTDGNLYAIKDKHLRYEHKPVIVLIDGFPRSPEDLDAFVPSEVESIRMIDRTGQHPATLVVTTKRYAGTDTASTVRLKQVSIQAQRINKKPDMSQSANIHGGGNADQVIMGDKVDGCITLSDCLLGKVTGVRFGADGTPYLIRAQAHLSGNIAMALMVDGVVLPGSQLNELNASDIYSIEVLRSGASNAVYGSDAAGGMLIITMKHGGESNFVTSEKPAGLITLPFRGYYVGRTFYMPKYTSPKTNMSRPDLRNTVYWNPDITTGPDGKASFEYSNNDTKGVYRIVMEGIDDEGNLGRKVFRYEVK